MKAYESREASAALAREDLGLSLSLRLEAARMALLSRGDHAALRRRSAPVAKRAARLVAAARELAEDVRSLPAGGRHRALALEQARDACAKMAAARTTLAFLASFPDEEGLSGWVPRVAATPERRDFLRFAFTHFGDEARAIKPACWAYFAIGAGLEPVVRDDARRKAKDVWHDRRATWGTDVRAVAAEFSGGAGKRPRSRRSVPASAA